VAEAFLDAFDQVGDSRYLEIAVSAADYLLNELYWSEGPATAGFAYPTPESRVPVHNAGLLGAALLCRVHSQVRDHKYLTAALKVARYSVARQREDGSWFYGERATQRWIDNFHTGFNLCALDAIRRHAETSEFESCLERGFRFYCQHFFEANGAPRYFHDATYPIDAHSVAQSIITLTRLGAGSEPCAALAKRVVEWSLHHLWDEEGYFYYRKLRLTRVKISYMRWTQAWMLLALATWAESESLSLPSSSAAAHDHCAL
jgi:rhamnogalacturonyl hydrolase YesR